MVWMRYHPTSVSQSFVSLNSFPPFWACPFILRSGMESPAIQLSRASLPVPSTCTFSEFGLVTQETVRNVILNSSPKSCSLDPLPTSLLKVFIEKISDPIASIVNLSLSSGNFPLSLKHGLVIPRKSHSILKY